MEPNMEEGMDKFLAMFSQQEEGHFSGLSNPMNLTGSALDYNNVFSRIIMAGSLAPGTMSETVFFWQGRKNMKVWIFAHTFQSNMYTVHTKVDLPKSLHYIFS